MRQNLNAWIGVGKQIGEILSDQCGIRIHRQNDLTEIALDHVIDDAKSEGSETDVQNPSHRTKSVRPQSADIRQSTSSSDSISGSESEPASPKAAAK